MSKSDEDELKDSLKNQNRMLDVVIEKIRLLNEQVPNINMAKKENDAKLNLINITPSEFVAEKSPSFLQIEKDNEEILSATLPSLMSSVTAVTSAINYNSSGSASYVSEAINYANGNAGDYLNVTPNDNLLESPNQLQITERSNYWLENVLQPFEEVAKYRLQRRDIPTKLDTLFPGFKVGNSFKEAMQGADIAQSSIANQSNAMMGMRNFLDKSLWGNLVELARKNNPSIQKGKLSNSNIQNKVARALADDPSDERKLIELLHSMDNLRCSMSSGDGKELNSDNLPLFSNYFSAWILIIDDILSLLLTDSG